MSLQISKIDLDRLADGELADPERLALLHRLELDPDGWRRCALAFLEAQAWRQAAADLARELAPAPALRSRQPAASRSSLGIRPRLAWAASLAAAIALGWAAGSSSWTRTPGPPPLRPDITQVVEAPPPQQLVQEAQPPPQVISQSTTIPVLDLERLQNAGYRIDETPGLVVETTPEGPRLVGPTSQLRIRYVGPQVY